MKVHFLSRRAVVLFGFSVGTSLLGIPSATRQSESRLHLEWTNNILSVSGASLPGGTLKIWYLEAFCRSGSTDRNWNRSTIPHQTTLLSRDLDAGTIHLRTAVEPSVEVRHVIQADTDEVTFELTMENRGDRFVDVDWFQSCLRVDRFTGLQQDNYIQKCFIFTESGLIRLDQTRRTDEARYRGGQVYVPAGIDLNNVNPRPISPEKPINGLIGCFSADETRLLATAWDQTQELFQGVIVCIHNDPRVGGLNPGETKRLRGKLYLLANDPDELLRRYRRDFGDQQQTCGSPYRGSVSIT